MKRVSLRARAAVFLRSLLLQASWNREGMQNLGFAFAIAPALRELYPEGPARTAAFRRHLAFFNTHPYAAAAILGGIVSVEERVAAGEAPPELATQYKQALGPPFAALGDAFFWGALRPTAALAGALVALVATSARPLWALVAFLGLYDVVHLWGRLWSFARAYEDAEGIVEKVRRLGLPESTSLLKASGAALAGCVAATLAISGGWPDRGHHTLLASLALVASYLALPRLGLYATALGAIGVGVVIGALAG